MGGGYFRLCPHHIVHPDQRNERRVCAHGFKLCNHNLSTYSAVSGILIAYFHGVQLRDNNGYSEQN